MALDLDIDVVWWMLGQWQQQASRSAPQKMKLAYAMAALHLADGYDVIVAQHLDSTNQYQTFARIAANNGAKLYELLLLAPLDEAIERCKRRGRSQGYRTGFRPGGILDGGGREKKL